jgi:CheY-like chemotaxis protein
VTDGLAASDPAPAVLGLAYTESEGYHERTVGHGGGAASRGHAAPGEQVSAGDAARLRSVLVVDPDEATRRVVSESLATDGELEVRSVASARAAMEVLTQRAVHILVTALEMPEMDGFELVAFALARRPEVSVVVIGDHTSGRLGEILRSTDSFYHLRRPVGSQQVQQLLRSLRPPVAAGHLQGLSLAGLLQMLGFEAKSCRVTVHARQGTGRVELDHGDIVHAECGSLGGREAAFEMLSWQAPELNILQPNEAQPATMRVSVAEVLIEAAWRWDENRRSSIDQPAGSGEWPAMTRPAV